MSLSTKWRMPTLRYILSTVPRSVWEWRLVEGPDDNPVRELVDVSSSAPTHVYCLGQELTPVARAIAVLNPTVLAEISHECNSTSAALERLETLYFAIEQIRRRVSASEHSDDLAVILSEIDAVTTLLRQRPFFAAEELHVPAQTVPPPEDESTP